MSLAGTYWAFLRACSEWIGSRFHAYPTTTLPYPTLPHPPLSSAWPHPQYCIFGFLFSRPRLLTLHEFPSSSFPVSCAFFFSFRIKVLFLCSSVVLHLLFVFICIPFFIFILFTCLRSHPVYSFIFISLISVHFIFLFGVYFSFLLYFLRLSFLIYFV